MRAIRWLLVFLLFFSTAAVVTDSRVARAGQPDVQSYSMQRGADCRLHWWLDACQVMQRGVIRGRVHAPCVHIPYTREVGTVAQVALFALDFEFDPDGDLQSQLSRAFFHDAKVTGPVDDFCLGRWKLARAISIVVCDPYGHGYIKGATLVATLRDGYPPRGIRVPIPVHRVRVR